MRIDINLKNSSQIPELQSFLLTHHFDQVNITEKKEQSELIPQLKSLSITKICLHFAAKNHQSDQISALIEKSLKHQITSFLIVSGIPRPKKDSIEFLRTLTEFQDKAQFAVCYTPFAINQDIERQRLSQKLSTGLVNEIYLQMGDDQQKIAQEVDWLRQVTQVPIIGSLLIPTPSIRHKFTHSQWHGVKFDTAFFRDQATATTHASELFHFLRTITDDQIIEMFPFSQQEYEHYAQPILTA